MLEQAIPAHGLTAQDWVLIIGAVFVGISGAISAWGTYFGRKEAKEAADVASGQLQVIHKSTNSRLGKLDKKVTSLLRENQGLREEVVRLQALTKRKKGRAASG